MKNQKISFTKLKDYYKENSNTVIITVLIVLLLIAIMLAIPNIANKQSLTTLEKTYIQNEFLDYNLIEILQESNSNSAKESFAYEYAKQDLNSVAITEDVFYYYYKLLFNDAPDSTSIVQTGAESSNINSEVSTDTNAEEYANMDVDVPAEAIEEEQLIANENTDPSYELNESEYRCFLTSLKKEASDKYVAIADIVTPKVDPMVTTPFLSVSSANASTNAYILATATPDNYTEFTDIVGKATLYLQKVDNRFVINDWDITLDN